MYVSDISMFRENCDVCGRCEPQTPEDYEDALEKYNVVDIDPRLGDGSSSTSSSSSSTSRQKRFVMSRMHGASKPQTCVEVCVR